MVSKSMIYRVDLADGNAVYVSATSKAGARRSVCGRIIKVEAVAATWAEVRALQSPQLPA